MKVYMVFAMAGFLYALPLVAGMNYLVVTYLHIGSFSWIFVCVVSLVPGLILGIQSLDL